jgi:hypothetical protein
MSITPIQYLLIENISVCYSPYYIANAFLQQEIAKVTEIRTHFNEDESILGEDPVFWYEKCHKNVLLQVEWLDTEAAYQFIQTIREADVFVEKHWYQEQVDSFIPADFTPNIKPYGEPLVPWNVFQCDPNYFHEIYPKHEIWKNLDFDHVVVDDEEEYAQDYDEDYAPNDTPATVIGKARTRYMMERAQVFGEEEEDFERRMDDDDE